MENRTKIIATVGPTSEDKGILRKMIQAGLDVVRLNFSHGTYEQFSRIIRTVRELEKELGVDIAIMQDLEGPKIRLGKIGDNPVMLETGQEVTLETDHLKRKTDEVVLPVEYRDLGKDLTPGDKILINDGLVELEVLALNREKTAIRCRVSMGGRVKSGNGLNVPTASLSADPMDAKDRRDLAFGIAHGVDYVALSFVRERANILALRRLLVAKKSRAKIIAKIERHEALVELEGIVESADAIMVARGDLGVEIPAERVPIVQKQIIHLSNNFGKPVIVATEMLTSMLENPRPTRAEVSDAATAIFDHADALMLTNETAVGKFPVEAVRVLRRVASAVEANMKEHEHLLSLRRPEEMRITDATCLNATKLARDIRAKFIVAITRSGYTVREIAKYRPFTPIIVFTPDKHVARQMRLVWGAARTFVQYIQLANPLPQIRRALLQAHLAKSGDEIVVCNAGFGKKEKLITSTVI